MNRDHRLRANLRHLYGAGADETLAALRVLLQRYGVAQAALVGTGSVAAAPHARHHPDASGASETSTAATAVAAGGASPGSVRTGHPIQARSPVGGAAEVSGAAATGAEPGPATTPAHTSAAGDVAPTAADAIRADAGSEAELPARAAAATRVPPAIRARIPAAGDVALIAYADSIRSAGGPHAGGPPLAALRRFARRYLEGAINTLHLLPFYPWDTDRGFSVTDYRAVDPRNGTWAEVEALAADFTHLMVDLVINHASLDNPLVQGALTGDPRYAEYVIRYDDGAQPDAEALAALARPRPHPVLARYTVEEEAGQQRATFAVADDTAPGGSAPAGGRLPGSTTAATGPGNTAPAGGRPRDTSRADTGAGGTAPAAEATAAGPGSEGAAAGGAGADRDLQAGAPHGRATSAAVPGDPAPAGGPAKGGTAAVPVGTARASGRHHGGTTPATGPRGTITGVTTSAGGRVSGGWVWTTFSRAPNADGSAATRQVDLNFRNPRVLLEMLDLLLHYRSHGADWVRLDAAGYLWKELGTPSIHHPNTHRLLQVLRDALAGAPELVTIAEVNEPQAALLPYLGTDDAAECDLVYQFAHFPLAVHALLSGDGSHYKRWLRTLEPFAGRQFITVLGSHDGMGRKPLLGLLPERDLEWLVDTLVTAHGALPNYAQQPGGGRIVYELCATPWGLLNRPDRGEELALQIDRYAACAALGLVLRGVPAFYLNGLLGVPNRLDPGQLDEHRSINREQFTEGALFAELDDPRTPLARVLARLLRLIRARASEPAFAPCGPPLELLETPPAVVAVVAAAGSARRGVAPTDLSADPQQVAQATATSRLRGEHRVVAPTDLSAEPRQVAQATATSRLRGGRRVVALTNVAADAQQVTLASSLFGGRSQVRDLITDAAWTVPAGTTWKFELAPYQVVWLTPGFHAG